MQYMGGKSRIAKYIVPHLAQHGLPVWDAFAGGLSISAALLAAGVPTISSDVREGLIRLYEECLAGDWSATADCTREEHAAVKRRRCETSGRSLARKLSSSAGWGLVCISFFDVHPQPGLVVYCDPPYRGTSGYGTEFDFELFDARVLEWARFGPVYVSEYSFPHGRVVWERASTTTLRSGQGGAKPHIERLYEVTP